MIKLGSLIKEIEVIRPFNGRITNEYELEQYLNFLERKEGKEIYGNDGWDKKSIVERYAAHNTVFIPKNIAPLYNLRYVEGSLSLFNCRNITLLPNNLTIMGSLDIISTSISKIPDNLNIGGNLYYSSTPLLKQYTKDEIKQLIIDKGGSVKKIYF